MFAKLSKQKFIRDFNPLSGKNCKGSEKKSTYFRFVRNIADIRTKKTKQKNKTKNKKQNKKHLKE